MVPGWVDERLGSKDLCSNRRAGLGVSRTVLWWAMLEGLERCEGEARSRLEPSNPPDGGVC